MWVPMRQLSIQITIHKSKPLHVNVRPSTRSPRLAHTEQQAIKGFRITSVKPFKRENQRSSIHIHICRVDNFFTVFPSEIRKLFKLFQSFDAFELLILPFYKGLSVLNFYWNSVFLLFHVFITLNGGVSDWEFSVT